MKFLFENWRSFLNEEERPRKFKYNYTLSDIAGNTIDQTPDSQPMYGASMNKPILAFVNLILAKEGALHSRTKKPIRRLTSDELDRLISYSHKSNWSNRINRTLSDLRYRPKWNPKYREYYNTTRDEIGINKKQAAEVLTRFGLKKAFPGVRWGDNHQTTEGYNQFMSLLTNISSNPEHEHWNEATEVLKHVKKRQGGTPGKGLQDYLNKELEKAGYGKNAIKTMYGKGGKTKNALNYSLILNNKYILSLYTKKHGEKTLPNWRKGMHEITLDTIKNNLTAEDFNIPTVEMPPENIHIDLPPEDVDIDFPHEDAPLDTEYEEDLS